VHNVKLRPAQPHALPRHMQTDGSTCWAQDSQIGSDDTSVFDLCPRPFKGVVICATGVVDKVCSFIKQSEAADEME
jgi:DNA replication regulator DPB11